MKHSKYVRLNVIVLVLLSLLVVVQVVLAEAKVTDLEDEWVTLPINESIIGVTRPLYTCDDQGKWIDVYTTYNVFEPRRDGNHTIELKNSNQNRTSSITFTPYWRDTLPNRYDDDHEFDTDWWRWQKVNLSKGDSFEQLLDTGENDDAYVLEFKKGWYGTARIKFRITCEGSSNYTAPTRRPATPVPTQRPPTRQPTIPASTCEVMLQSPTNGEQVSGNVKLNWSYSCQLAGNEEFDVRVFLPGGNNWGVSRTRDTAYTYSHPSNIHGANHNVNGRFNWQVVVMRGNKMVTASAIDTYNRVSHVTNNPNPGNSSPNPNPANQETVRYYVHSTSNPACGEDGVIKLTMQPLSSSSFWAYVTKCDDSSFTKSGSYYLRVDNMRDSNIVTYSRGDSYSRQTINLPTSPEIAQSRGLIGWNQYQVELWPSAGRDEPYWSGIVWIEGRIETP